MYRYRYFLSSAVPITPAADLFPHHCDQCAQSRDNPPGSDAFAALYRCNRGRRAAILPLGRGQGRAFRRSRYASDFRRAGGPGYPRGLPERNLAQPALDVQKALVRSIRGFEAAEIPGPGFAIEYDYFDPRDLRPSLETRLIEGLYFAGQINGTTGYEEAAGQGLIAGLNAARQAPGPRPLVSAS
ncbi:MAG: hypothetical protein CM1200mP20_13160 [Pseudomonadota bacterium]|nr:MAG: hypothetical protein CM1200mP20_13160 [Pseudomonadota bacterium]